LFKWELSHLTDEEQSYCGDCGAAFFQKFERSIGRKCNECDKLGFFDAIDKDYPSCFQSTGSYHITIPPLSLDPTSGGQKNKLFRPGLKMLIEGVFIGESITDVTQYSAYASKLENDIDTKLMSFDCLQGVDLNNTSEVESACHILNAEGLKGSLFELIQSINLNNCLKAIKEGNAEDAAFHAHNSSVFRIKSVLEDEHLSEILWLGHRCYDDLKLNEEADEAIVREKLLIHGATETIKNIDAALLFSLSKDSAPISQRLNLSGIRDEILKSLIEYEIQERHSKKRESFSQQELSIKSSERWAKWLAGIFGIAFGYILKGWIA
jgi:hypothetical protein